MRLLTTMANLIYEESIYNVIFFSDPVPLVRERLDQEESEHLPLSLVDETSGDAILSPQFPTVFIRSASPSFPALPPHTSPQEPPKTTHDKTQLPTLVVCISINDCI